MLKEWIILSIGKTLSGDSAVCFLNRYPLDVVIHSLNYCVLDVINWKKRTSKETLSDKNILLMTFSPTWHVSFMNPVHHFLNLRFPDHLPLRRGKIAAGGTHMSIYIFFFSLEAV